MGITEILRRIWLFSANKIKSCESVNKQPESNNQLNSSLQQKLDTLVVTLDFENLTLYNQVFEKKKTTKILKNSLALLQILRHVTLKSKMCWGPYFTTLTFFFKNIRENRLPMVQLVSMFKIMWNRHSIQNYLCPRTIWWSSMCWIITGVL